MINQVLQEFKKNKVTASLLIGAIFFLLYYGLVYRPNLMAEKEREALKGKSPVNKAEGTNTPRALNRLPDHVARDSGKQLNIVMPSDDLLQMVQSLGLQQEYAQNFYNPFHSKAETDTGFFGMIDESGPEVKMESKKVVITYRGFYVFDGREVAIVAVKRLTESSGTMDSDEQFKTESGNQIPGLPFRVLSANSKAVELSTPSGRILCPINTNRTVEFMTRKQE
ncbi:MAG: hypothetical protein CVV64_07255 [Candidatus Wallbacteria bacterium HGW-Wallbacteria-1]|jgi:hypothetical protein|uniref:Uncharacterized protein n=1 Tax=Candidatus Wallbacteria bacterium HGW-Wallbacteria-1 TaxID=2013854 RepID=A0A2N1PQX9_9BACT|nr:MAG: hypothetical protein CVV64_07255 [Candidatus Wallbacteria bacterium HGW-Wallbacteria-1]